MSLTRTKLVVLTGAGISAESGVKTFRDAGGLWEGHRVEDVATPEAWRRHPDVVLQFYNDRRRQLLTVQPNAAHLAIARLQDEFDVTVITQNVDDLHERAGSRYIIHLHGELLKARSSVDDQLIYSWTKDILKGDQCELGSQLRPHIVWFGEMVPMLEPSIEIVMTADIVMVVGSSMQVYPAASLVGFAPPEAHILYVDPRPQINFVLAQRPGLKIIAEQATSGVIKAIQHIRELQRNG